jgi:hypothetical protein
VWFRCLVWCVACGATEHSVMVVVWAIFQQQQLAPMSASGVNAGRERQACPAPAVEQEVLTRKIH